MLGNKVKLCNIIDNNDNNSDDLNYENKDIVITTKRSNDSNTYTNESDNDDDDVDDFNTTHTNTNVNLKNARSINFNNAKSRENGIIIDIQHIYND